MSGLLSEEDFKNIYTKVPRACIDLVIETANGLVLLKREEPPEVGLGICRVAGSGCERVLKKQLKELPSGSWEIELGEIVGYDEYLHEPRQLGDAHSIAMMFRARITSGSLDELIKQGKVREFKQLPQDTVSVHKQALERFNSFKAISSVA